MTDYPVSTKFAAQAQQDCKPAIKLLKIRPALRKFANMKPLIIFLALLATATAFSRQAPDFGMETRDGGTYSLDSLRTPLTLLYFTNIDCDICKEAGDSIASSPVVGRAIADRRLTVLSVYVGDDRDGWLRRKPRRQWVECIDSGMSVYGIADYDFSYLPAFYLIDNHRNIMASPQSVAEIEKTISGTLPAREDE